MNSNDLRYFCVLADTLHYGRAAQILYISQPPLTRTIQRLEEELGVQLFVRNQRKVVLTLAGEHLKRKGDALLAGMSTLQKEVKMIDEGRYGQLHITSVGSVVHRILQYTNKFIKLYPDVNVRISQYTTTEQIRLIKSGDADIAFLRSPVVSEGLQMRSIYEEPYVLVTPPAFRKQIRVAEDLVQLADMPYISFPREHGRGSFDRIITLCNAGGYSPDIRHEAYQLDTAIRMVEVGMGITIVPECALWGLKASVNTHTLDFMSQRSTVSCFYDGNKQNEVLNNFIEIIE